jgi:hypothetical protein
MKIVTNLFSIPDTVSFANDIIFIKQALAYFLEDPKFVSIGYSLLEELLSHLKVKRELLWELLVVDN